MGGFTAALAAFVLLHVGISATGLRAVLIRSIGVGPYRIAFSIASAVLLVWMIMSFGDMRADPFNPLNEIMWSPPAWLRHVAYALIFLGVTLAIAGVLTPGPTFAGFEEKALAQAEPARGVLRITRHPFLWGVAFWAAGHLIANGERFALMLFGALGLMVLLGARSIDRKNSVREGWDRFEAATSNIPFAAIAQGRNRLAFGEMWWRLLVGAGVFAAIGLLHKILFGVAAFSTGP